MLATWFVALVLAFPSEARALMPVPVVGLECKGPLLPFPAISGSPCDVQFQARLKQLIQRHGHRDSHLPDAVEPMHVADVDARTTTTRILIIDDNDGALHTFASAFRRRGFEVSEAVSGAAGLALAQGGALHAVVVDQCLPDLTGLEVLAQLRAFGCGVPVVMMSGWPTPQLRTRAEELGACGFLTKPVSTDELLQAVERAVQAELPLLELDVVRRAEPASQAMSKTRQSVTELGGHCASISTTPTPGRPVDDRQALLDRLARLAVWPGLSVRELLVAAEAIRRVVRAPGDVGRSDLTTTVLDALARVDLSGVRRPVHHKVVEVLARLASGGQAWRMSEPDLADAVGLSPSRLSGLLRPQTGLDLRQWKRGLRMRQAVQRLGRTDQDVSEIAASLGYRHASQFDNEFNDLFSLTPREFRSVLRASAAFQ